MKKFLVFVGTFVIFAIVGLIFLQPVFMDIKTDADLRREAKTISETQSQVFVIMEWTLRSGWSSWGWKEGEEFLKKVKENMTFGGLVVKSGIYNLLASEPLESLHPGEFKGMIINLHALNFSLIQFRMELDRVYYKYRGKFDHEKSTEIKKCLDVTYDHLIRMNELTWQASEAVAIMWDKETWKVKEAERKKCCEVLEEYLTDHLWVVIHWPNQALNLLH